MKSNGGAVRAGYTFTISSLIGHFLLAINNASRYYVVFKCMVHSFACDDTARLFRLEKTRAFPPDIQRTALRKLVQLHAVTELLQLRVLPGNRLEALKGDRKGQHSIRINDQWRVCFRWESDGPHEVEIVDYH